MKKLFLHLTALATISSCSLVNDDDPDSFLYVFVPVVFGELLESSIVGQEYHISLRYSSLIHYHENKTIDYIAEGNKFFIGLVNTHLPNEPFCDKEEGLTDEASFSLTFATNDFYIFNFWQGQNEQGNAKFLTIEVPVISLIQKT